MSEDIPRLEYYVIRRVPRYKQDTLVQYLNIEENKWETNKKDATSFASSEDAELLAQRRLKLGVVSTYGVIMGATSTSDDDS